jgi:hypothetical protein
LANFTLSYPTWFLLICIIIGVIYSYVLYRNDIRFVDKPNWLQIALKGLRFASIALVTFLLLTPIFKSEKVEEKKPMIVFLRDQSQSINLGNKAESLKEISNNLSKIKNKLIDKFDIVDLAFGDQTSEYKSDSFQYKITNISQALDYVRETYADQNIGAIILATDGIYNEGSNPAYVNDQIRAPIFTVGMGDTSIRKDLAIADVLHNKIAYLGDKFGINVGVNAFNAQGTSTKVTLSMETESGGLVSIGDKSLNFSENIDYQTVDFTIDASKTGLIKYVVSVSPINGEYIIANNRRSFFVEVIDARQKVLVYANSPHPDVAALNDIISTNKNYEVTTAFSYEPNLAVVDYDLVIFHNLPSSTFDISSVIKLLDNKNVNRFFIAGAQIDQVRFNAAQEVIRIGGNSSNIEVVEPTLLGNFDKFTLSEETRARLTRYPPLTAVFGTFSLGSLATTLMNQRIKKVPTNNPLLAFEDKNGKRTGAFVAEGLWKWRLQDMIDFEDPRHIGELINKSIQYLSVKDDKRRFRVNTSKTIYRENENISLDAQLYNESYEMVNTPEVEIVLKNRTGQEYKYNFSKVNNYYLLNAGNLAPGSYTFSSKTNFDGKAFEASGRFSIESLDLEINNLTAQHGGLRSMSIASGGQYFHHSNFQDLENLLLKNDKLKPTLYSSISTNLLLDKKWYFFLLLLLLGLEWFLRRYFGSY